jgi:hypothetical protein
VRPDSTEEHDLQKGSEALPIEEEPQADVSVQRKPRPSLSERTMETLQNIPSSPAMRKRGSSFFTTDSPMRPTSSGTLNSRPGSSSDGSMRPPSRSVSSRPSSRAGFASAVPVDFRASTNTFRPPQVALQTPAPLKRPATKSLKTPTNTRNNAEPTDTLQESPSLVKSVGELPTVRSGSKTLSSRPLKPRASVNGLFRKPSMPALDQSNELDRIGYVPKKKSATLSNTSSEAASSTSKSSKATSAITSGDDQESTPRKSSLALRDQIAKAKAAKRAATAKQAPPAVPSAETEEEVPVMPTGTFDFGLSDDPFNQQMNQNGAKGLLRKRIAAARTDGRLNIAAMGFKEIPEEVMNMYNLESVGTQDGTWAESVDLTRFVAADNELELIADDVFPDVDPQHVADEEDGKGNQFGGE